MVFFVTGFTQLVLLMLMLLFPLYLMYKAFKDNAGVIVSLYQSRKITRALLKTLLLWSPFGILVYLALLIGSGFNSAILDLNESAWSNFTFEEEKCGWLDLTCKNLENAKKQMYEAISRSHETFTSTLTRILSTLAQISNILLVLVAIKSFPDY